jgi:hypothetical protein
LDLSNSNKRANAAVAGVDVVVAERPISIDKAEIVAAAVVSVDVSQPPPRTGVTSNFTGSKSR